MMLIKVGPDDTDDTLRYEVYVNTDIHYAATGDIPAAFAFIIDCAVRWDFDPKRDKIQASGLVWLDEILPGVATSIVTDKDGHAILIKASVKDGDSGGHAETTGKSVIQALVNLLRCIGYQPHPVAGADSKVFDYIRDYQYGLNRISDELLQQEMEEVYQPEKGAW